MTKFLITFLFAAFAFQIQAQVFVSSPAQAKTLDKLDAIEMEYVNKRKKDNKMVTSYKLAKVKEAELLNYLSQKTGKDLSKADAKTTAKAHREIKKTDTKYAALYKDAAKVIRKKRNRFAKGNAQYKSLLDSLTMAKKKK